MMRSGENKASVLLNILVNTVECFWSNLADRNMPSAWVSIIINQKKGNLIFLNLEIIEY